MVAERQSETTPPQEAASADGSCAAPTAGPLPLVALLGRAERAFAAEFDRRLAASEFCALSLAHSRNILRHLGSGPVRASQIVQQCDVSKQAVSQQLAHLERNGYITVTPDPEDHRARVIALTERGEAAQHLVKRLLAEIESDWATDVGTDDMARLRAVLRRLLDGRVSPRGCSPASTPDVPRRRQGSASAPSGRL